MGPRQTETYYRADTSYLKSVQFYFPNDLDASTQTINHIVVDVAGFSSGVVAFTSRCEQARQLVCPSCSYA